MRRRQRRRSAAGRRDRVQTIPAIRLGLEDDAFVADEAQRLLFAAREETGGRLVGLPQLMHGAGVEIPDFDGEWLGFKHVVDARVLAPRKLQPCDLVAVW